MKKYIFILRFADCTHQRIYKDFECDADAMKSARETLREWRKERDVLQIDVFEARRFANVSWISERWVTSYY